MQAGGMKSTSDISHVCHGVQVAEHSEPIDENDVGALGVGCVEPRERERVRPSPALDRAQVRVARFVWGDCEPRVGNLVAHPGPGGEKVLFVGRPRRAGHESRARRAQPLNERRGALRARPHLVEPRVARHAYAVGWHALFA
jgi:hypothetical protein